MTPLIDIQNATALYDGKVVLEDLSWRVEPGENWFILGRNGSGKTTLMNVIMAYKWPRYGASVEVLGRRYGVGVVVQDVRRRIGWFTASLKEWTHGQTECLQVVLSGYDCTIGLHREATAAEIAGAHAKMEELQCDHLSTRNFATLSSGEQMKVLLSRATVQDPELLILDEPACHLDLATREAFLHTLNDLVDRPTSPGIILVTHRIDDITPLFTNGLILHEGRAIANGNRDDILQDDILSNAFELNIQLHHVNDRYWPVITG